MLFGVRSVIILILSILTISFVSAQKFNSFAGVRYGPALPMGEMASHEFGYGGYALLGKSVGVEAAWFFNPKLGVGIDYSSSTFGFASGYYAEDYMQSEPAFSSVDLLSGLYDLKTYMAGVYNKMAYTSRFSSTFKLMGGIFRAKTPDQFFGVNAYMTGKLYFWKTSAASTKFTFLTGASFEYRLYKQVSLLLQADFTYARGKFYYSTGETTGYTDYMHMPIFKLEPGINIHF